MALKPRYCSDAQRRSRRGAGVAVLAAGRRPPHRRASKSAQLAQDGRHRTS